MSGQEPWENLPNGWAEFRHIDSSIKILFKLYHSLLSHLDLRIIINHEKNNRNPKSSSKLSGNHE